MTDTITRNELEELLDQRGHDASKAMVLIDSWIERGDVALVYENAEFGHPNMGDILVTSYGGEHANLEDALWGEWPERLPDMGGLIGWRYMLTYVYEGDVEPDPVVNDFVAAGGEHYE